MKFRKKPVIIDATQWFKNGDHPEDRCDLLDYPNKDGSVFSYPTEGKVVRFYRHPVVPGEKVCRHCQQSMNNHGWIDTLEGGHVVCPGDWIITGVKGEHYPCKPDIFDATYEAVEEVK